MAMNYKPSMTKAELLEIAAANGVQADDSMTKTAILAALDGANSRAPDGAELNTSTEETAADGQQPHRTAQDRPGTERGPRTPPGRKRPQRTRRKPRRGTTCSSMPGPSLPRRETERKCRVQRDVRGRESVPCGRDRGLSPCSADDRPC